MNFVIGDRYVGGDGATWVLAGLAEDGFATLKREAGRGYWRVWRLAAADLVSLPRSDAALVLPPGLLRNSWPGVECEVLVGHEVVGVGRVAS